MNVIAQLAAIVFPVGRSERLTPVGESSLGAVYEGLEVPYCWGQSSHRKPIAGYEIMPREMTALHMDNACLAS
jgi:hypothetical protein